MAGRPDRRGTGLNNYSVQICNIKLAHLAFRQLWHGSDPLVPPEGELVCVTDRDG